MTDPYENLANAIVLQEPLDRERSVRSGWHTALTRVFGEYLIQKLREDAKSL